MRADVLCLVRKAPTVAGNMDNERKGKKREGGAVEVDMKYEQQRGTQCHSAAQRS